MDVHIPRSITNGLRMRGIDVLTAHEDGTTKLVDPELLDRATALSRVLVTFDQDLLAEASHRQAEGIEFAGVVYAHPLRVSVGVCIEGLELVALASAPDELANRVQYLPL
jgi:hypothetical protein